MNIQNFHVLTVKYIWATNTNAAQVKIISERFEQSVKMGFTNDPGASSPTLDTAISYFTKNGFNIIGKAEGKNCYYVITDSFKHLKVN